MLIYTNFLDAHDMRTDPYRGVINVDTGAKAQMASKDRFKLNRSVWKEPSIIRSTIQGEVIAEISAYTHTYTHIS